jgi:hypothetical protein
VQIESPRGRRPPLEAADAPTFLTAGEAAPGEYHCAACGYGITVRSLLPECPMCRGTEWEEPATSPYGRATR